MRKVGILLSLVLLSSLVVPVAMAQEPYNSTVSSTMIWTDNPRIEFQGATIAWIGESEWRTVVLGFPEDLQENFITIVMNEIQICDPLVPDYNPNAVSVALTEFNMCADENSNPEKFNSEVLKGINELKEQNSEIKNQNKELEKQGSDTFYISLGTTIVIAAIFLVIGILVTPFIKPKIN